MARDGTISGDKLLEIMKHLPREIRISPLATGNLMVYGLDKNLGYIDCVLERFISAEEILRMRDEEVVERALNTNQPGFLERYTAEKPSKIERVR